MGAHSAGHQIARHYQRLLVGQQNLLTCLYRRQCGQKPRRAYDSRHDNIGLRVSRYIAQSLLAVQDFGRATVLRQPFTQRLGRLWFNQYRIARVVLQAQLDQTLPLAVCTERENPVLVAMPGQYIQGAHADGAGRSQHRYRLPLSHTGVQPITSSARANTGAAAVRLSTRSSTPPWPGKSAPLS